LRDGLRNITGIKRLNEPSPIHVEDLDKQTNDLSWQKISSREVLLSHADSNATSARVFPSIHEKH